MHLKPDKECVSMGPAGARTRRSLGHHLLHSQILMLLVLLATADFEAQIPNVHPAGPVRGICEGMGYFWKFRNAKG